MNDSDIFNVVQTLVGYTKDSYNMSLRDQIKDLLPIETASGYYLSNKVEFYDPIQDQVFYRNYKYNDEKTRLNSLEYINGRID